MQNNILKHLQDTWKICKYEFLMSRILVLLTLVITAINIFLLMGVSSSSDNATAMAITLFIQIMAFFMFLMTYYLSAAISFYHGLFGKNAYLTHSLPISLDSILLSKVLIFFLWACVGLCEVLFFIKIFDDNDDLGRILWSLSGMETFQAFIGLVLGILSEITYIFMITSIVHRKKNWTLAYGIMLYFGIKVLLFIIVAYTSSLAFNDVSSEMEIDSVVFASYLFVAILTTFYYFISRYIIKHKLSL